MAGRAETQIIHRWSGLGYTTDGRGNIASFKPARIAAEIFTVYGQGATRTSRSAYGRGTTAADVAAGTILLGFHEGRHGDDFIQAMNATPLPTFGGAVGQSEADFLVARSNFGTAVTRFFAAIETASEVATDCVGTTIDQLNAQQGIITTICPAPAPPVGGGGSP